MTRRNSLLALSLLLFPFVPARAQQFGGALAISGDQVLVGETGNQNFPGIVYVYNRIGGTWMEVSQMTASDNEGGPDGFGRALATQGPTLLVGAPGTATTAGAVYVLRRDGSGNWTETGRFSSDDGAEGDAFGRAVVVRGDVALVSASGENDGVGAVYVMRRTNNRTWSQQAKLTGSDAAPGGRFGAMLALDREVVLIGAPGGRQSSGAAYVFRHDSASNTWTQEDKFEIEGLGQGAGLGTALGLRDGLAFIGAPGAGQRSGMVLVARYDAETGEWTPESRLGPFTVQPNTQFGSSIAFDGANTWIGAPGDNTGQGAFYVFEQDGMGNWTGATKLTGQNLQDRAAFASTVAIHDDVAVAGALGVDSREGAAVILERDDASGWRERNTVINEMKSYEAIAGGEVPCTDDRAAGFECSNVDVLSFLPIKDIGGSRGTRVNDIWGWTDPQTGREYVMVGRTDGVSFVDISDPYSPVYVGDLPKTKGSRNSIWRDFKVYKDHAYIVADNAGEHGVQVFDLRQLRNVRNAPVTFEETFLYDGINSAHNIVLNEETGYAYAVGSSGGGETCGGGLHMINIQDPGRPTFAGCFADPTTGRRNTGYTHDGQCVQYHGPDADYNGREICLGSNETALSIADVTDKENPIAISRASYPNVAYTHQGWLTEDHRYFYLNDEGDEPQGLVAGTRTLVWDVTDLDDPILVTEHIASTTTTDHNLYIRGDMMYQSNYGSGLRVLDISNPENPVEVGFFDTTPYGGGGSWSNYPYFESGAIVFTSMSEGLFIVKSRGIRLIN